MALTWCYLTFRFNFSFFFGSKPSSVIIILVGNRSTTCRAKLVSTYMAPANPNETRLLSNNFSANWDESVKTASMGMNESTASINENSNSSLSLTILFFHPRAHVFSPFSHLRIFFIFIAKIFAEQRADFSEPTCMPTARLNTFHVSSSITFFSVFKFALEPIYSVRKLRHLKLLVLRNRPISSSHNNKIESTSRGVFA